MALTKSSPGGEDDIQKILLVRKISSGIILSILTVLAVFTILNGSVNRSVITGSSVFGSLAVENGDPFGKLVPFRPTFQPSAANFSGLAVRYGLTQPSATEIMADERHSLRPINQVQGTFTVLSS